MPLVIGAKQESGFDDPIGLLSDCHRRIERFLSTLLTIAGQTHGAEMNSDQRLALKTALRYFRESAPRHTADEEESLFPYLRTRALPATVSEQIASLEREHEQATAYHHQIDCIGHRWLAEGELQAGDLQTLTSALAALTHLYREHLAIEDTVIFPFAAQALSDSQKAAIGCEMAVRRGLDPATLRSR